MPTDIAANDRTRDARKAMPVWRRTRFATAARPSSSRYWTWFVLVVATSRKGFGLCHTLRLIPRFHFF